jgi:hypothetical protein
MDNSTQLVSNKPSVDEWEIKRKTKSSNEIPILPFPILINIYNSFKNHVSTLLYSEITVGEKIIGRIPNFPEYLSENIILWVLKLKKIPCRWDCSGDILTSKIILNNGEISCYNNDDNSIDTKGECKCHYNGPTQFSPNNKKKEGDNLFYLEAEDHLKKNGHFKLYLFTNYIEVLRTTLVNNNSTQEQQASQGRRSRFLIKDIWGSNIEDKKIWEGNIYQLYDDLKKENIL